jgi:hypothetical protein
MPISIATCLYKCQAYFATFQTAFDKYLKDSLDIYIEAWKLLCLIYGKECFSLMKGLSGKNCGNLLSILGLKKLD